MVELHLLIYRTYFSHRDYQVHVSEPFLRVVDRTGQRISLVWNPEV